MDERRTCCRPHLKALLHSLYAFAWLTFLDECPTVNQVSTSFPKHQALFMTEFDSAIGPFSRCYGITCKCGEPAGKPQAMSQCLGMTQFPCVLYRSEHGGAAAIGIAHRE